MLLFRLIYVNMKVIIQDTMNNWKIYVFLLQTLSCLFCLSSERLEQTITEVSPYQTLNHLEKFNIGKKKLYF